MKAEKGNVYIDFYSGPVVRAIDSGKVEYLLNRTIELKLELGHDGRVEILILGHEFAPNDAGLQYLEFTTVGIDSNGTIHFYAPVGYVPDYTRCLNLIAFAIKNREYIIKNQSIYHSFDKNENRNNDLSFIHPTIATFINWSANSLVNKILSKEVTISTNEFFNLSIVNNRFKVRFQNDSVDYYNQLSSWLRVGDEEFFLITETNKLRCYKDGQLVNEYLTGFSILNYELDYNGKDTIFFNARACHSSVDYFLPKKGSLLFAQYGGYLPSHILMIIFENKRGYRIGESENLWEKFREDRSFMGRFIV